MGLYALYDSVLPEMLEESADAREDLSGTIPRCAKTRAGRAVSLKRPEGLFVDLLQIPILDLEPNAEVGDSVEVETDNLPLVPGSQESLLVLLDKALKG